MEAITNYIAAALLILVIILGFTTYIFHGDKQRLQAANVELTGKLRESEANVLLAAKSCEATQAITDNVAEEIETKQTVMTKTLETLATVTTTLPEKNLDAKKYADDARLSPNLMRLLGESFCNASPSNPSCSAKRATTPLPSGTSRK